MAAWHLVEVAVQVSWGSCGSTNTYGAGGPLSCPARERRAHAEQIEARERAGDFFPASELSGEIKLLLLLCVFVFGSCSRERVCGVAAEPKL